MTEKIQHCIRVKVWEGLRSPTVINDYAWWNTDHEFFASDPPGWVVICLGDYITVAANLSGKYTLILLRPEA